MVNILYRPFDLLIVTVFTSFLAIAVTIDYTQAVYGSVLAEEDITAGIWPPAPVLKAYAWWCEHIDPLLAHNPSWYETMAMFSPFLYVPYYCIGIFAFIAEKEWIRIPTLMWGYGLLLTMVVILREELYGSYPTKDVPLFLAAYGPYALMPIIIMARVARYPVFGKREPGQNVRKEAKSDTKTDGRKAKKSKKN